MTMSFTDEQQELRHLVRRFLEEKSSPERVRERIDAGAVRDDAVWRQMAEQLGLQGLAIPEEYGGAGFGPVELGIVLEEMGRRLYVGPYFSTVALVGQLLTEVDDEAARETWLPSIADGSLTAALAVTEDAGSWDPATFATRGEPAGDGWRVSGAKSFVVDAVSSGLLVVAAVAPDGLGFFGVDGGAPGVAITDLDGLDLTRGLARVEMREAPAIRIAPGADGARLLERVHDLAVVALASEQAGGAARALETAVEYAKIREQFGRPIGSFQAIKHKCADMLLKVESARSAAYYAASVVAGGGPEARVAAALAKSYCSEAFTHVAKENIQVHGGIGYTWEHDAHLYLKRAKSAEVLFGSPVEHRARLATLIGI
ncbi:acyl-CoA dehydrogenase family protein [Actinomadura sp. B10D3]|uniref:acyl-CoA dehydrogenase family protein n=1 Tax=Actinomadura sp. B10D3 TaxID=3153557 RepID=UPI00325DABC1